MLKRKFIKRLTIIGSIIVTIFILFLFPDKNNTDINISNANSNGVIYLMDKNDYLSRLEIMFHSKNDYDLVHEIINLLTINSDSSYMIRDGFYGVIPDKTKLLSVVIDNNILYLDFNRNILYGKYKEEILEALVYSVTSNIDVKSISILIEGGYVDKFPNTNIAIPKYLDRSISINKDIDISSMKDISITTIYYPASYQDIDYYIPVTKVNNDSREKVEIIIDELKSSSTYNSNIVSYINENVELIDYKIVDKSFLLNFNEYLFGDLNIHNISEEITYSINLSLNDNYNIDSVMYSINDDFINNYFLLRGWACK